MSHQEINVKGDLDDRGKFMESSELHSRVDRHEMEIQALGRSLESLGKGVHELGETLRKQGDESSRWREELGIRLERASAPRATQWPLIISFAMLAITIGALAFTPLNWRNNEVQKDVDRVTEWADDHSKLTLHPVGAEKVSALERRASEQNSVNAENIRLLDAKMVSDINRLRDEVKEVQQQGSPITRERLAILEAWMKNQKEKP